MKFIHALAATAAFALATPALAQNAGQPGAVGVGGSLIGSNPGSGQRLEEGVNPGPGYGYPDGPRYLNEGRASAPDYGYEGPDYGAPAGAWRPQTERPGVGADLVGPGSNMDSPTDGHDVSR